MSDASRQEHTLPAGNVLHLIDLVHERWGVAPEVLLAGLELRRDSLVMPGLRLPIVTIETVAERARELTGEPALGFHLGLRMQVSWHGFLGFAAMSASTVREAIELSARFAPTRTSALGLRLEVDGERAALVIEERAPLGSARDLIVVALAVGLQQIGGALVGRPIDGTAAFAFPEPSYFERYAHVLSDRVRFGQPENRLVFAASVLELPLAMADPTALRLAREQCERELDALGRDAEIVGRARALLRSDAGGAVPSVDEVARAVHVSARTLKRKLAGAGTSYTELVREERRDRAVRLLRAGELSIEEVAARVGYADATNFARAFRRWTGMTPRAFRRAAAPEPEGPKR